MMPGSADMQSVNFTTICMFETYAKGIKCEGTAIKLDFL